MSGCQWLSMCREPSRMALYSAMLLVHLSVSLVKCSLAAYHSFLPKGDIKIPAAPALVLP
jgi:hypothetical protein